MSRVTETTPNAAGWVAGTIRNRTAGAAALVYAATSYAHDAFGNIVRTTAGGVETTLVYDLRGRKTTMTDPAMSLWRYAYNPFGELVWQKDAKSQISTFAYDSLGRFVTRTETEGTTTWTYDTAPHAGAPSGAPATWMGLLGSVSSPGGYSETHTYNAFGAAGVRGAHDRQHDLRAGPDLRCRGAAGEDGVSDRERRPLCDAARLRRAGFPERNPQPPRERRRETRRAVAGQAVVAGG